MSGNSVINTNLKSLIAQDSSSINNRKLSTAMERLSTGNKINSAKDDAAGLAISTRMDSQVRGLNMAVKNAYDTVSLTETAEGAMEEVTNMLQRMRELALQSSNDTNSDLDRRYLQDEIDQLAAEIDRVANTTQFNSINVLDGSYSSKVFQIGSNRDQTMNISIGSMNSSVLGVATSNSAASSTNGSSSSSSASGSSAQSVDGSVVEGTAADQTVVNLKFFNNGQNGTSGTDVYTFTVTDDISGLGASVANATVDMTNQASKDEFLAKLNLAAQTAQTDTRVTSGFDVSAQLTPAGAGLNLDLPSNYGKVKFAISIDGGATVQLDLRDKLISTANVESASVTTTEIITAMTTELQRLFDARVQASAHASNGGIVIEDDQGRRIKVTQGAGDGSLFGTDERNTGGLLSRETVRNSITAEWQGDSIVLTNTLGGKVSLSGFTSQNSSTVLFDTVKDSQADGINEPIVLGTATANVQTNASVSATGHVEETRLNMRFSDRVGDGASAEYSFRITNGDGDDYATISNLSFFNTRDDATIAASVMAALSAGIVANYGADSSFDVSEFDVVFKDNQLQITNTKGRAVGIEDFSSTHGYATVTPVNEPGDSQILASQNAYYSETRVGINTGAFGLNLSATGTNRFTFTIDGVENSANLTVSVDGASAGVMSTGAQFAASVQAAIRDATVDITTNRPTDGTAIASAVTTAITVTYDADTAELVFRDPAGRSLGFGYDVSANLLLGQGVGPLNDQRITGAANKMYDVNINSAVAQGDVRNATEVTLTLSDSDSSFNFSLNGQFLDGSSTNSSAALLSTVGWDTTQPFDTQDLKRKLDDLMVTLNAPHPEAVFEYAIDSATNAITFYQRDGGELVLGNYVTASTHKDVTATLTPAKDQGESANLSFLNHTKATSATGAGTLGVATTATLNLEGDDLYGLMISDGTQSYTMNSTVVDISNTTSVGKFADSLEEALLGSSIKATMDTDGNIFFKREDGGQIILQEFTSATGKTGQWRPSSGQGENVTLDGKGTVPLTVNLTSSGSSYSPLSGGGNESIAELNIQTQAGASSAIAAIDSALAYVQAERSNLGAIQNRLTHTIDNLSNIVTSTSAAQSRIRDTDYAKETSELARTQIISQAANAMLAQANQQPQQVLQLLQ